MLKLAAGGAEVLAGAAVVVATIVELVSSSFLSSLFKAELSA